jgi:glycosyltransferase involved in cell wall biosynthesis
MLSHRLDKTVCELRVAVVTPTYQRDSFLAQTHRYFGAQANPFAALRWFVLDDSPQRSAHPFFATDPSVDYQWLPERVPLGAKRNLLNDHARRWGSDIICSMDDDDWYGPDYLSDMATLLLENDGCFAGSGDDYYYDARGQRVLFVPAPREAMSCNGVLCYKTFVLESRRYDASARSGEEMAFIQRDRVLQHPDVGRIHLALASGFNTVSKRGYLIDTKLRTTLTVDDFPMTEADRVFYRERLWER